MSNLESNLSRGIGRTVNVIDQIVSEVQFDDESKLKFAEAVNAFDAYWRSPEARRQVRAFVCALLNESIVQTGRVYQLDSRGEINSDYIFDTRVREMIGMGIEQQ